MEEAPPSSTVGSNPWRPPLRQLSNDLLPVTAASRVVSTPMGMAKLECPLQVVGCWLVDGRLNTPKGSFSLVSVYLPILSATPDA